jgi:hypothetical protein
MTASSWMSCLGLKGGETQWVFDRRAALGGAIRICRSDERCARSGERDDRGAWSRAPPRWRALPARPAPPDAGIAVREKRRPSAGASQPARPATATAVNGFLLAGDWIDTGLPGTIESAVVSGHRAAELAMGRCG